MRNSFNSTLAYVQSRTSGAFLKVKLPLPNAPRIRYGNRAAVTSGMQFKISTFLVVFSTWPVAS